MEALLKITIGKISKIRLFICFILLGLLLTTQSQAWEAVESDHFVVMHNDSQRAARNIQRLAENFYPRVTGDLGYEPERKITIWFARSHQEFNLAVGAPIQDWAAGAAYPLRARIIVRDPAYVTEKIMKLDRLVKHEIVHVVFGLYLRENLRNVPRWFNEGLAMHVSGEWTYSHYWTMLTGALGNSVMPFYRISEDFPQSESQAQMAYAQSCSFIRFIARKYGEDTLRQCIKLLAEGRNIDEALAGSVGWSLSALEGRWLKSIKSRYKWVSLISSWIFLWTIAVLILVLGYWRRKVKNRRIMEQWEAEEGLWWEFDEDEEVES